MAYNTPWCPRCGAWRGYIASLCKGCVKLEASITEDMLALKKANLLMTAPDDEKHVATVNALTETQLHRLVLQDLVQERFVKISEMRTDREAFTQSLEEMVERNVEVLKEVAYSWMRMRPESRRVRFSNMRAAEMIEMSRRMLEEMGSLSLQLTKFTENKPEHDERMQRIMDAMKLVNEFESPNANEPEEPAEEPDEGIGAPGAEA
jgi:hypothetical protein